MVMQDTVLSKQANKPMKKAYWTPHFRKTAGVTNTLRIYPT